ncbi:MAG: sigma-54 dependent transcriptional regulator [bacterium]|nr:sigma-54 dependent transcriptional regulator [bacterium]
MRQANILVVDDEKNILTTLSRALTNLGYAVKTATSAEEALELIRENGFDLAIIDLCLKKMDNNEGLELLKRIRELEPEIITIMMSGHGTMGIAVQAGNFGAVDFIEKPLSLERIQFSVEKALKLNQLERENIERKQKEEAEYQLIGTSKVMRELYKKIEVVAPTNARVLICGENGTGKELVARAIHYKSPRKNQPFIKVNCAAIPAELIESELFGHEKGAFTGATERRRGKFELADGGTIFLDEIGDMSLPTQAKILRVLTDGLIDRVGGSKPIKVDVRVLAATNKNLEQEIQRGNFREDLYYRLNVIPFHVPPLRERKEDIQLLAEHFLNRYCEEARSNARIFTPVAIRLLMQYDYPGNVRELKNIVERAAILIPADRDEITEKDIAPLLPTSFRPVESDIPSSSLNLGINERLPLKEASEQFERAMIISALERNEWNVSKAALELQIERSHLYKKMKTYGIERKLT